MELRFHPAAERPKTTLGLCFFLGIVLQGLWQFLSPAIAIGLFGALLFSLRDYFLPTEYRFSEQALSVSGPLKGTKEYSWERFRAFVRDRNGVFLSPYRQKRITEGQRAIFLPLTKAQRSQVCQLCENQGLERRAS